MTKGKYSRKKDNSKKEAEQPTDKAVFMDVRVAPEMQTKSSVSATQKSSGNENSSWWVRLKNWAKDDKTFTDWCIAAFTVVLAGAAIYQFIIMGGQLAAMRTDQRAWLKISAGPTTYGENKPFVAPLTIVNSGKTAAKTIRVEAICEKVKNGDNPSFTFAQKRISASTGVLFPGEPFPFNASLLANTPDPTIVPEALSGTDFKEFMEGNIYIATFAKVTYEDVFGVSHRTQFCVFSSSNQAKYASAQKCTAYNDVDRN
jgi:hypothetical protein